MPEPGGLALADLGTALIFDDHIYLTEALHLPTQSTDDDVDSLLALQAREAGIEDPYRFLCPDVNDVSTAMSTVTLSSEQRSSMSIHSRETQSTAWTSQPSRTSRDHPYADAPISASPILRSPQPPPFARASLSLDSYDSVMDRFRPASVRHRDSSSTFSVTNSVRSTGSSSLPKLTPRKHKRASQLFAMFRRDSSTCPSRSHHGHHAKAQTPKLECGHALSKYAIRVHIQEALDGKDHLAPSCCGKPLPRPVLETVLSKEEADIVTSGFVQSPELGSLRDSGYSEDGMSSFDLPRSVDMRPPPAGPFVTAPNSPSQETAREDGEGLDSALANEAFKSLKAQQKEEFRHVSAFESNQKKALALYREWSLKRLAAQLETTKEEKESQHIIDLERLEEAQVIAEHDLRKTHDQEAQNVATALKYMEAYCSGANPANPEVTHAVTDEDRKKLARQYMTQQKLPAKHESAISVLRARQERDTKIKLQKQQAELRQLDAEYEKDKLAQESEFAKAAARLDATMGARRRRIVNRWELRFEMWRRDWEAQHGAPVNGCLAHEEWPLKTDLQGPIDEASALAVYLQTECGAA